MCRSRLRSLHVGHSNGVVAFCGAPEADAAASDLAAVLEAAQTGKLHNWSVDKRLADPPRDRARGRGPAPRPRRKRAGNRAPRSAYEFGQEIGRQLIENGYRVSLGWNATGVRMRLRL